MKNWKLLAVLVLVFVLGTVAGGLLTARVIQTRIKHVLAGGPDAVTKAIVRRMSWQLRLDDTQRARLFAVVGNAQKEVHAVRQTVQPQVREIIQRAEAEVRGLLRPDQIPKFDKLTAEQKARWEAFAAPP